MVGDTTTQKIYGDKNCICWDSDDVFWRVDIEHAQGRLAAVSVYTYIYIYGFKINFVSINAIWSNNLMKKIDFLSFLRKKKNNNRGVWTHIYIFRIWYSYDMKRLRVYCLRKETFFALKTFQSTIYSNRSTKVFLSFKQKIKEMYPPLPQPKFRIYRTYFTQTNGTSAPMSHSKLCSHFKVTVIR